MSIEISKVLSGIVKRSTELDDNRRQRSQYSVFTDELNDKIDNVYDLANNSKPMVSKVSVGDSKVTVNDRYMNSITSDGDDNVLRSFTNYGFSNDTLNFGLWVSLYNDSWVFKRAIDKPAEDEINCGILIKGSEDYTKAYAAYNKFKPQLIKILKWGALFGGAIGVMMFKGMEDEDYLEPLSAERTKRKMKIYVADRWYGCVASTKRVSDMDNIDYGLPESYMITFADGHTMKVHHSYVLRYEHRDAPNLIKNGQLQGWGYAEGAHILNELARDDQLKSAITTMVDKSNIEVIKMAGMKGLFLGADKETESQLKARLEMVNWGRNYNSLTFLDKDDDYQMNTFSGLSGLSDILEQNLWLISAALEMQGILYGNLQGGLSTDTDDMGRYAITIRNRCNAYVRPLLQKFLKVQFMRFDIDGPVDFEFNSINLLDDNNKKVEALEKFTNLLNSFKDAKVISTYQMALSLKTYFETGTVGIAITDEQLDYLKAMEDEEFSKYKKAGNNANMEEAMEGDFDAPYNGEFDFNNPQQQSTEMDRPFGGGNGFENPTPNEFTPQPQQEFSSSEMSAPSDLPNVPEDNSDDQE